MKTQRGAYNKLFPTLSLGALSHGAGARARARERSFSFFFSRNASFDDDSFLLVPRLNSNKGTTPGTRAIKLRGNEVGGLRNAIFE